MTVQTKTVRTLPAYAYSDSVTVGSHKVVYMIAGMTDETLPVVVDDDEFQCYDMRYTLAIEKDKQPLFNRSFTKADFNAWLTEDFKKCGVMGGMRFNKAEDGKLFFNACVCMPESDMMCPFILTIGPDGSYAIEVDTSIEDDMADI